jgi:hypothetical protein
MSSLVQLPTEPGNTDTTAPEPVYRLLVAECPAADGRRWRDYWLTSLVGSPVGDILSLTRHSACAEAVAKVLADDFGLNDFEGRSFPGWHHHMTLVGAAYAYTRLHRPTETTDPNRSDLSKFALPNTSTANHNEDVEPFEGHRGLLQVAARAESREYRTEELFEL